jgi:ketopantoate reductase
MKRLACLSLHARPFCNRLMAEAVASLRVNVAGTPDERIAALTENLRRVDEALSVLQRDILDVKHQAAERIDSERSERLVPLHSDFDRLNRGSK